MKCVCAHMLSLLLLLQQVFQGAMAQGPAQPCDPAKCQPPNCRCVSLDIPGNLHISQTPQIVTINFDDSFRVIDYEEYFTPVFGDHRKNPNGCPIGFTFFNSHQYTDYALVERAQRSEGYEFASHSISHRVPSTWWATASVNDLRQEISGQKTILTRWGGIPEDKVKGFRAPYLQTSENELRVLYEDGFLYEASMGSYVTYWPFTLDYKSPLCTVPATCPVNSYPGLWIIPNVFYLQSNGHLCSMIDACTAPITEDDWYDFLMFNFNAHYTANRAPFGIHAHAAWFVLRPERARAMNRFLDTILLDNPNHDVYIVTQSQVLDWVRNPTPLDQLQNFTPWQCNNPGAPHRCEYNAKPDDPSAPACSKSFTHPVWSLFKSCEPVCPVNYPTVGNPLGN